ncbi:rhodanese-like domain-containing protein [Cohnella mopanensis]|uniref:rhodanese-like domain-containing protein n=1 Tax=Cohnella mopanensis TaxID=2911966 RepID=UPI001EF7C8C9|nr:rhodanese-like domain-containing protein [Cohnella mopanensis]
MELSTILGLLLIVVIVMLVIRGFSSSKGLSNYNAEQFGERLAGNAKAMLIDVREVAEFRSGHLPRAINIPLSQLQNRIGEVANVKDREVLLYCRSGMRSKRAAAILRGHGLERLGHLQGGIMSWRGKITN